MLAGSCRASLRRRLGCFPPAPPLASAPPPGPARCEPLKHRPGLKICLSDFSSFLNSCCSYSALLLRAPWLSLPAGGRCRPDQKKFKKTLLPDLFSIFSLVLLFYVFSVLALLAPPTPAIVVENILYHINALMDGFIFNFVHSYRIYNYNEKTSFKCLVSIQKGV